MRVRVGIAPGATTRPGEKSNGRILKTLGRGAVPGFALGCVLIRMRPLGLPLNHGARAATGTLAIAHR